MGRSVFCLGFRMHNLPAEDVLDISGGGSGRFKIAVPKLSRIANFDDLDPLSSEPGVTVEIIQPGRPLPGGTDLVLIPGSKSTIGDLKVSVLKDGMSIWGHISVGACAWYLQGL